MNNEKNIQNGAGHESPQPTSSNNGDRQGACPPRALRGKIARLPKEIREELNCRLDDNQPAPEILPWLNELPAVKQVLAKYFSGKPINHRNISNWRIGGYQRWVERQESAAEIKELAEDMEDFSDAAGGKVARIAAAKILKLLHTIPVERGSIDELTKISYAVSALLNADQNQARLELEKKRVELRDEQVSMQWDKQRRDGVAIAQRALDDAIAKDIQAAPIDNAAKIELLGYRLYGDRWQGRKVGKKEAPQQDTKNEQEGPKNGPENGPAANEKATHHETVNQGLVPRLEEARPHPGPLPLERENHRPMIRNDERARQFQGPMPGSGIVETPSDPAPTSEQHRKRHALRFRGPTRRQSRKRRARVSLPRRSIQKLQPYRPTRNKNRQRGN